MKSKLLFISVVCFANLVVKAQTMTFDSGASETGFSFNGWNAASGTIYLANLANPATITVNSGTWNLVSFDVISFGAATSMRVTSNLGNTFDYSDGVTTTHTLNWNGITTVTFSRVSGSGAASDHDNVVYSTQTLGTQTLKAKDDIFVYPNPVTTELFIANYADTAFAIYNMLGKVVQSGVFSRNGKVDVRNLEQGIYLLRANNGSVNKFVKQ